jgi:hypothetical protein
MSYLRNVAIGIFAVTAATQSGNAQKSCGQITPAVLAADAVPPANKIDGPGCQFSTVGRWRGQSNPGILAINPHKSTIQSPDDFDKLLDQWQSAHGRRCGLELGLGTKAAWCPTGSVTSMEYQLLILRGDTVLAIELHNWTQPPNPAKASAITLAKDVFGPASEEAPLVRPKD